jgi:putative ABC transport system substrate-binding protein
MQRREFITLLGGAAAAWPVAARAQQQAPPVVGYLSVGSPFADQLAALRKGLSEQGYVEGRNFIFEGRSTDDYERMPALAAELAARRVAVILTFANLNAARAAKAATASIPIVFTGGADPVREGLVASLNRPGGNVTGASFLTNDLEPKRLELLRELVPRATTLAYLVNPTNPGYAAQWQDVEEAARKIGQRVVLLKASTPDEIDAAFAILLAERAEGLLIGGDGFFVARRSQLIVLAVRHAIPSVYFNSEFTKAGGLISYAGDRLESLHQAGSYIGRILKGEKPADLPVQQSTKFEFAINLRTAKALGIEFPPSFHLRATEVIE